MRTNRQLDVMRDIKNQFITLYEYTLKAHYTSEELSKKTNEIMKSIPLNAPKNINTKMWYYLEGLRDSFMRHEIAFYYKINGKMYSIRDDKTFPKYDTLDKEIWCNSGFCKNGGLFYKNTDIKYS